MVLMHKVCHSSCNAHWAYKTYYLFLMYKVGHFLYGAPWDYKGCYLFPGEYEAHKTYYFYFKRPPRNYESLDLVELI